MERKQKKILKICYAGWNDWYRAVFCTIDGRRYFKSTNDMPHPDFEILSKDAQEVLLKTLCTTDEFDGEPGFPVARESIRVIPVIRAKQGTARENL